jgi:hypothetical protein
MRANVRYASQYGYLEQHREHKRRRGKRSWNREQRFDGENKNNLKK